MDRTSLQRLKGPLHSSARYAGKAMLGRVTRLHVNTHRPGEGHAILGSTARKMRRVATRDQRLGRGATSVDAGAAEKLALDNRDFPACGHQPSRQGRTRLSGSDDYRIVIRHDGSPVSSFSTAGTIKSTRARHSAACKKSRFTMKSGVVRSWTLRVV